MTNIFTYTALRAALTAGALAIAFSASAQAAVVYDFKHTGGAGSDESGSKLFVEVTDNLMTTANDVLFKFTSQLPIYNLEKLPSISRLYFDTGSYTSLFTGSMSITGTPGIVNLIPTTPLYHPFFQSASPFTPDYQFGLSTTYPLDNPINGINPGEYAVVSATLGTGKTFADVISAMNVGLNSNLATAATGLRIGEFAFFLNGTGLDDGAFVTKSVVSSAPVPVPAAWPLLMSGLGLMGFLARRRKV